MVSKLLSDNFSLGPTRTKRRRNTFNSIIAGVTEDEKERSTRAAYLEQFKIPPSKPQYHKHVDSTLSANTTVEIFWKKSYSQNLINHVSMLKKDKKPHPLS
eukprot:TRINITY_DN14473_c0_g1_i1.p1 TRINITY_DN14473_c0_g1~~TRINITY_DN14473_c0_g1_i1.p1  ORF type:complete len:101 (+),score=14.68 TRINITY_DN14473_c0_g1_i1:103-405(+)